MKKVTSSKVCGSIYLKREYYRGYTCHAACNSYYEKEYACRGCGRVTGWQPTCGYS